MCRDAYSSLSLPKYGHTGITIITVVDDRGGIESYVALDDPGSDGNLSINRPIVSG